MKYVLLLGYLCLLVLACKRSPDQKVENKSCNISGRFINQTVLSKCPAIMPVDIPHYALELSFNGNDTVEISNGFEKIFLSYLSTDEKCTFQIPDATRFGAMHFIAKNDTVIELIDSSWTKVGTPTLFSKITNSTRSNWGFEKFFNVCAIAGNYTLTGKDGKKSQVYFLPNGQISGLWPYIGYTLCYAGDCLEETETPANIIEFMNEKGEKELFVYRYENGKSVIRFFRVGPPKPEIKGERTIGELAFELKEGLTNE